MNQLFEQVPEIEKAGKLARQFKSLVDNRQAKKLDQWIKDARESDISSLKNFALGLLQDFAAIKAALSLEWSNGQVEGQINRLKNIKRQMYGRAGFELLRKRVLTNSS